MEKINEFILKGDNLYATARSPRDFHQCVIAFFFSIYYNGHTKKKSPTFSIKFEKSYTTILGTFL